jgi:CDP-diacylglycerol--glycerol-3-phosphate 3-phosphatidyltransferase
VILAWIFVVFATFSIRLLLGTRVRFDRIDKIGGSFLLSQGAMEAGYSTVQPLVRVLVAAGVTANMLTWSSLVFGATAGAALANGAFGLGALLGTISMTADALDGLVARATRTTSDGGEVLDAAVDRYTEFFFIGGLAFHFRLDAWACGLAMFALLGALMISYSSAKAEALQVPSPKGAMRRHERAAFLVFGAVGAAFSGAWELDRFERPIGIPMLVALGLIAVVANLSAVRRFGAIARSVSERERASAPTSTIATADVIEVGRLEPATGDRAA